MIPHTCCFFSETGDTNTLTMTGSVTLPSLISFMMFLKSGGVLAMYPLPPKHSHIL